MNRYYKKIYKEDINNEKDVNVYYNKGYEYGYNKGVREGVVRALEMYNLDEESIKIILEKIKAEFNLK